MSSTTIVDDREALAILLTSSLPHVRRYSTEAAAQVEAAIGALQVERRTRAVGFSGRRASRSAVIKCLTYAISDLEEEAPKPASCLRSAVRLLVDEGPAPI